MTDLIIITGASRGLGAALAATAPFEARIVDVSRSGPSNPDMNHLEADLADPETWDRVGSSMQRLVEETEPARSVFIHAAGVLTPIGFAGEVDSKLYSKNVLINSAAGQVLGHHYLQAVAGRDGHHQIVMISSGAASSAYAGWSSYGAAKAALDQWVRTVGKEQEMRGGVKVYAIAPGVVATDMQAEIRDMSERQFPEVERFRDLHRNESLYTPEEAATRVWMAVEAGADNGSVLDVRDLD